MKSDKKTITIEGVKQAFLDPDFRALFPDLNFEKAIKKPGCGSCNTPIILEIVKNRSDIAQEYFEKKWEQEIELDVQIPLMKENDSGSYFKVINCHINDLSDELNRLDVVNKFVNINCSRYEDQITAIVHIK